MIIAFIVFGVALALAGIVIIEKRRKTGTLTYPLWQGNLFIPWALLALAFAVLMGTMELPRAAGLAGRGMPIKAVIVHEGEYCRITYRYRVEGKEYTGEDSKCGLNPANAMAFFDPDVPENSTLHLPAAALRNTLIAMALVSLIFPTFIVLWLMASYVIGRPKKP